MSIGLLIWLVGWFLCLSSFVSYLMPNPLHTNEQFYIKQFSLAYRHSLIVKNISIKLFSLVKEF